MKLPVDTSAIAFLCAVEAEPVVDFETKRPRADENGEPLYVVQLIAMTDGAAATADSMRAARNATPERSCMVQGWATSPCTLTG